jgi:hypothetical protein
MEEKGNLLMLRIVCVWGCHVIVDNIQLVGGSNTTELGTG